MAGIRHIVRDRSPADIVNLGYVVNVIEDPDERLATLQDAWHLAREVLVVAARLETDRRSWFGPTLGDGNTYAAGHLPEVLRPGRTYGLGQRATGQVPLAARRESSTCSGIPLAGRHLRLPSSGRRDGGCPLWPLSISTGRTARLLMHWQRFYCDRGRLPRRTNSRGGTASRTPSEAFAVRPDSSAAW